MSYLQLTGRPDRSLEAPNDTKVSVKKEKEDRERVMFSDTTLYSFSADIITETFTITLISFLLDHRIGKYS